MINIIYAGFKSNMHAMKNKSLRKPFLPIGTALRYNHTKWEKQVNKGGHLMKLLLILVVTIAFLAVIFASGYNDKPGKTK